MTIALECQNIVSGYLNRPVLHSVSLEVASQTAVALIGPNGHGKTTLLRTLSGLLPLRGGMICVGGVDMSRRPVHKRVEAGLIHVPQGDQIFTEMSVEENLHMGAYLCSDRAETGRRLQNAFSLFPKLKERRNQLAAGLSGGERRMLGIGRALMSDCKVLMLDEPSLGLAPKVIEQIYQALSHLRSTGMAMLVVEENPSRLMGFADRLCLMDAGQIVWHGDMLQAQASTEILRTYLGEH